MKDGSGFVCFKARHYFSFFKVGFSGNEVICLIAMRGNDNVIVNLGLVVVKM